MSGRHVTHGGTKHSQTHAVETLRLPNTVHPGTTSSPGYRVQVALRSLSPSPSPLCPLTNRNYQYSLVVIFLQSFQDRQSPLRSACSYLSSILRSFSFLFLSLATSRIPWFSRPKHPPKPLTSLPHNRPLAAGSALLGPSLQTGTSRLATNLAPVAPLLNGNRHSLNPTRAPTVSPQAGVATLVTHWFYDRT